jgi:hypothetical protein
MTHTVRKISRLRSGNGAPLGPGPHVFVYDKDGRRYRVQVPSGKTAEQVADDLLNGKESDRWISE